MNDNELPQRKDSGKALQKASFIEKLSGRYTNTFAVFLIFIFTLISLLGYIIFVDDKSETIITGLFGILTTTLGYFAGKGSSGTG